MKTIIKGNIISSDTINDVTIYEDSYLVSEDGIIKGIYKKLPQEYENEKVDDYGNCLVFQSFSDMHLHAPQYPMLGMGMDLPLMEWLSTYTFPTESVFKDKEIARRVYKELATKLIENGTTRVAMFSSLHLDATLVLMDELEKAGISGFVGKVNMDRNSLPILSETTQESIDATDKWLEECKQFKNIKPIITPRFTISCTNELMEYLGKKANELDLPIQSHLNENKNEIAFTKELHPECEYYYQTYEQYGLWNNKTLMAHVIHVDQNEMDAIKKAGVYVVHCPSSNINIISGLAPIRDMIKQDINVVLGTDIAGGNSLSMFDAIIAAIQVSKAKDIVDGTPFLTVEETFYLATSAANKFFGEQPGFATGNKLHAIVIDDSGAFYSKRITTKVRFERAIYNRATHGIKAVYANGKKVFSN